MAKIAAIYRNVHRWCLVIILMELHNKNLQMNLFFLQQIFKQK